MEKTISRLTVFFEEPFWVSAYEREYAGKYEVCKIIFGAEPKDYEVYDFILQNFGRLRFSPSMEVSAFIEKHVNPKRMRRNINRQLRNSGIGTKAQQALKLQQEQGKLGRKLHFRSQRETEKDRQFQLQQEKRKEKHRGH